MSLQASENRHTMRHLMEACKIVGGHLTITEDMVQLTTEDDRIVGLNPVAEYLALKVDEHWEKEF